MNYDRQSFVESPNRTQEAVRGRPGRARTSPRRLLRMSGAGRVSIESQLVPIAGRPAPPRSTAGARVRSEPGHDLALFRLRVAAEIDLPRGIGQGAGALPVPPAGDQRARQQKLGVSGTDLVGAGAAKPQRFIEVGQGTDRVSLGEPRLADAGQGAALSAFVGATWTPRCARPRGRTPRPCRISPPCSAHRLDC